MFLVYIFVLISLTFFSLSVLGLFRFPDVYTRLHSSTLATTFGFLFFALAMISYILIIGGSNLSLIAHIIIITIILLIIEPSVAHTISRMAHKNGIKPEKAVVDKLNK